MKNLSKTSPSGGTPEFSLEHANSMVMKAGHNISPSPTVARSLNYILVIVLAVLAISSVVLILIGILMLFPNGIRDNIFNELQSKNLDMPSSASQGQLLAMTCFAFAIISGAYAGVLVILRKIVKTLMQGDPFVPANISRLRIMWIILAASEVFRMLIQVVSAEGDASMISIRLGPWFMVFVIAALSEVFRHGAELRRDQELTV